MERTSVTISVRVGGYDTTTLFLDIRGVKSFFSSSGSAYLRGINWVITLSSELTASIRRRVSTLMDLALTAGTILIMLPAGTAAKPCTSSTDSNTRYASSADILVGETMETFPLTALSITKFFPVSSLINLIKTGRSTSSKSMVT